MTRNMFTEMEKNPIFSISNNHFQNPNFVETKTYLD